MLIGDEDTRWIRDNHPGLELAEDGSDPVLRGDFAFAAAYDEMSRQYIVNPNAETCRDLICIRDQYAVRVELPRTSATLPKVIEVGGRIAAVAKRLGKSPDDLHINSESEACMWAPYDLPQVDSLWQFLQGPVLQFFYDQSHFERYGRWPRGQYSHGLLGVLESYYQNVRPDNTQIAQDCVDRIVHLQDTPLGKVMARLLCAPGNVQGHWPCLCGSQRAFRDCHNNVFHGLWRLRQHVRMGKARINA